MGDREREEEGKNSIDLATVNDIFYLFLSVQVNFRTTTSRLSHTTR